MTTRALAPFLIATGAVGLILTMTAPAQNQSRDARTDALEMQTAELKQEVADQGRRIAELEKQVVALQTPPKPASIPAPVPPWHSPANWGLIKPGMSEMQVVAILGPPTNVQAVEDTRKLFYTPDPKSTNTLTGNITLMDDRVIAMSPPSF
jgi:hypothetical protein